LGRARLKRSKKDYNAQFHRAEKTGEGMALKIRTRAEDKPDGKDNLENRGDTKWKRTTIVYLGLFRIDGEFLSVLYNPH